MGQFNDCDNPLFGSYKEQFPDIVDEHAQYTYKIRIGHLGASIDLYDGKQWVRSAIVELAKMISRNLECNSLIFAEDLVTHSFAMVKENK